MWQLSGKFKERKEEPKPIFVLWAIAVTLVVLSGIACFALSLASSNHLDNWTLSNLEHKWATSQAWGLRGANIPLTGLLAGACAGCFGIAAALVFSYLSRRKNVGIKDEDEASAAISKSAFDLSLVIHEGVKKFLFINFKAMIVFVFLGSVAIAIGVELKNDSWRQMCAFIFGVLATSVANVFSTQTSVWATSRVLYALRKEGVSSAVTAAFQAASTVGILGISVGTVMLAGWLLILRDQRFLAGIALGASTTALVQRVWGGLFAKSAELLHEQYADNKSIELTVLVGSQISETCAAATDAIESFITAVAAVGILGTFPFGTDGTDVAYWLAGVAVVSNVIAVIALRGWACVVDDDAEHRSDAAVRSRWVIRIPIIVATVLNIALGALVLFYKRSDISWRSYTAYIIGVGAAFGITIFSDLFTSSQGDHAKRLVATAETSPARQFAHGIFQGLYSTFLPVVIVFLTIIVPMSLGENHLRHRRGGAEYLAAIAALGYVSIAGVMATVVSFSAIANNVRGIAANTDAEKTTTFKAAVLDDQGRSNNGAFRGWAAGAAILVAHVIVRAFVQAVLAHRYVAPRGLGYVSTERSGKWPDGNVMIGQDFTFRDAGSEVFFGMDPKLLPELTINLLDKRALSGLLTGAVTPFLIVGLLLDSTTQVASEDQLETEPVNGVVSQVEKLARRAFVRSALPIVFAIALTMLIGFAGGPYLLATQLLAAIIIGFLLATAFSNSGSTFDSARRYIEAGSSDPEQSPSIAATETARSSAVIGQMLKDGSSGTVTALIKYTALVALVFAPPILEACKSTPIWEGYCFSTRSAQYLPRPLATRG